MIKSRDICISHTPRGFIGHLMQFNTNSHLCVYIFFKYENGLKYTTSIAFVLIWIIWKLKWLIFFTAFVIRKKEKVFFYPPHKINIIKIYNILNLTCKSYRTNQYQNYFELFFISASLS